MYQKKEYTVPVVEEINTREMTPKSIEACRRLGYRADDLKKKTVQDIVHMMKLKDSQANPDQETLLMFQAHLEERRATKIKLMKEERAKVENDEKNGLFPNNSQSNMFRTSQGFDQSMYTNSQMGSISLVEKEKRMLEKMKRRQEVEIEKMIEFEKITEAIRQQNELKM